MTEDLYRNNGLFSIHYEFPYELGVEYKTKIKKSKDLCFSDSTAKNIIEKKIYNEGFKDQNYISYGEGFHFFVNKERVESNKKELLENKLVCVECVVPKGSRVYYDETGLGVSNRIILNKLS